MTKIQIELAALNWKISNEGFTHWTSPDYPGFMLWAETEDANATEDDIWFVSWGIPENGAGDDIAVPEEFACLGDALQWIASSDRDDDAF